MKKITVKKDWLMFGIFMVFFIAVGVRISHSLIAIKNTLNYGITIRHMDAGKWEKQVAIFKDKKRWREKFKSLTYFEALYEARREALEKK